jgi:hypothetical protein
VTSLRSAACAHQVPVGNGIILKLDTTPKLGLPRAGDLSTTSARTPPVGLPQGRIDQVVTSVLRGESGDSGHSGDSCW